MTSKFWPHFAHPDNVELCLDVVLKGMGLEYLDLWLAHWPFADRPISREALENAKGGPGRSPEEQGMLMEGDSFVKDWEHCSENIAKQQGIT